MSDTKIFRNGVPYDSEFMTDKNGVKWVMLDRAQLESKWRDKLIENLQAEVLQLKAALENIRGQRLNNPEFR